MVTNLVYELRSYRAIALVPLRIALLALAIIVCYNADAQNPMLHVQNTSNVSLDYMPATNEYLLGHQLQPLLINGMNNEHFSTGIGLGRIGLQVIPENFSSPSSTIFKTYCTVAEVNDLRQRLCTSLSTHFSTFDVKQTADSGFIICGRADRTSEFSNCPGTSYVDAFLLKTNKLGAPVWYKRYRPQTGFAFWFYTVIEDATTGNIIVGGQSPNGNAFVMGTDGTGNLLWKHEMKANLAVPQPTFSDLPSSFSKVASYISLSNQQYYVLTGPAIVHFNGSNYNAYFGGGMLTVVDAIGNLSQNVQLTQDYNSHYMKTHGVADALDGDIVLTGSSGGTYCGQHDDWDMMLMKLDPFTLTPKFMKIYESGSSGSCNTGSCTIGAAGNGNAAVVGIRDGHIYVTGSGVVYNALTGTAFLETDNMGIRQRYLPHAVTHATDGRDIVYNGNGGYPVYSGVVYTAGSTSTESFIVKNSYGYDGCDPDTQPADTNLQFDYLPNDEVNIDLTTIADNMVAFDVPHTITNECGTTNKNVPTAVQSLSGGSLTIAPNPASDYVDVQLPLSLQAGTVHIYDVHGRIVKSLSFTAADKSLRIAISNLVPGMYLVNVQSQGNAMHTNFVKQ